MNKLSSSEYTLQSPYSVPSQQYDPSTTTKMELQDITYDATAFQYMNAVPQTMLHEPQPGSPESTASSIAPSTPPTAVVSTRAQHTLNEITAKASSLPEGFYPEFLQYSKETYEQSTGLTNKKRRRRANSKMLEDTDTISDDEDINEQSEQKRRAQIKDGFDDLRTELPSCFNKKMSKVALLHRTVQHIQHLKNTQMTILSELERLVAENEQLRKFQETTLQKQAMENMYSMGQM
ncbi:unnamed protein product [Umbelopsis sp. WA50703]